jgi:hypothetical protein
MVVTARSGDARHESTMKMKMKMKMKGEEVILLNARDDAEKCLIKLQGRS